MLSHFLRAEVGNSNSIFQIAFRSSATSTGSTIVAPSNIVAGDLLVLYDNVAGSAPSSQVPSGFNTITDIPYLASRRAVCSYKIATGSEAGATLTGMSGSTTMAKILLVFSTNGATAGTVKSIQSYYDDGNPPAQTITSGSGTAPLLVCGFIRSPTGSGNSMSPTQDGIILNGTVHYGYYKIYNSSPSNVTFDTGTGNFTTLISFFIEVS